MSTSLIKATLIERALQIAQNGLPDYWIGKRRELLEVNIALMEDAIVTTTDPAVARRALSTINNLRAQLVAMPRKYIKSEAAR